MQIRHKQPMMSEDEIRKIKLDFEKKRTGANTHRITRATYRINDAWKRYKQRLDEESYQWLLRDIAEAKSQVW